MIFSSSKTRQIGAVLVEFAITIPILITLVMGTIEIGWALYIQNTLVDAARYGTRIAVTDATQDTSTIQSKVKSYIQDSGIDIDTNTTTVTVEPSPVSAVLRGTPVTVSIDVPYDTHVSLLPAILFLGTTHLKAHTTMAKEY